MDTAPPVEVRRLIAKYGDTVVLDGVDLVTAPREITAVLGGSGCGKSTLLRHALGLYRPAGGTVKLFGKDVNTVSKAQLKEIRANIGVLFQSGALFTSMTVGENVAVVIRENTDLPETVIAQMVRMKLSLVGLEDAIAKYPEELSGGMRKRASLARAIASDPQVLFCDEPSAGLDPVVASELDDLLLNLKKLFGMTLLVVTHEVESIRKIADRVLMLDDGHVIAEGPLEEVVASDDRRVSDFFNRISHTQEKTQSSLYAMVNEKSQI